MISILSLDPYKKICFACFRFTFSYELSSVTFCRRQLKRVWQKRSSLSRVHSKSPSIDQLKSACVKIENNRREGDEIEAGGQDAVEGVGSVVPHHERLNDYLSTNYPHPTYHAVRNRIHLGYFTEQCLKKQDICEERHHCKREKRVSSRCF